MSEGFLEFLVFATLIGIATMAFNLMVSCEIQSRKLQCFENTKLEACLK